MKSVGLNASRFLNWLAFWPATHVGILHRPATVAKVVELGYAAPCGPGYILTNEGRLLVDRLSGSP